MIQHAVPSQNLELRLENSENPPPDSDVVEEFVRVAPGWLFSLLLHAGFFFALAVISLPAARESVRQVLTMNIRSDLEAQSEWVQLEFKPEEPQFELNSALASSTMDASLSLDSKFDIKLGLPDLAKMGAGLDLFGGSGPEFFGSYGTGKRFAFVIDRSSSMTGEKFEAARKELLIAINRLEKDHSFYVVFFDRGMMRMFGKNDSNEMLKATADNLQRVEYWIRNVQVGSGTRPLESLQLVMNLKPDTIFLLTDGRFSDGTASYFLHDEKKNRRRNKKAISPQVRMNTIGFHHRDDGTLERLAQKFNGTYRFIPEGKNH